VRSDVGSSLAVTIAVTHLAEVVRRGVAGASLEDVLRREVPEIVEQWRNETLAHLASSPFTTEEASRTGDSLQDQPIVAYGATLLIAVVCSAGVGLAQVGDGDALIRTHGFATRPVPGDPRLVAGETTSLCLDSAVEDFRYAAVPATAEPDLVLLSSDGYGNSFSDPDWWRAVVRDLVWFIDDHSFEEFASQFPGWLAESAEVGGDDVTAVAITRTPLLVAPDRGDGAAVPSRPEPPSPSPAVVGVEAVTVFPSSPKTIPLPPELTSGEVPRPDRERRQRRRLGYLLLAVSVVVVAAVLFVVLRSHGGTTSPKSPATNTTTPSSRSATPSPSSTRRHHRQQPNGTRTPSSSPRPGSTRTHQATATPSHTAIRDSRSGNG
jgi:hypothetical protein